MVPGGEEGGGAGGGGGGGGGADGERKASAMDLLVRTRTEIVVRLRS